MSRRFCFGDTETTGLGKDSGIVEISWVETDEDFNEVARYYSLINPEVPIQPGAQAVHGISAEMVKDAPTIKQFMWEQKYPLAGPDVVLVAHNAPFDINYFGPWMDTPLSICTLRCARIAYPEVESHKLGVLKIVLGLEGSHEREHSADEDVALLLQLTKRLCIDLNHSLPDLLQYQKKPRPITKISFGKHKGKLLKDLPGDYVDWLLNKADNLDADLRASLLAL